MPMACRTVFDTIILLTKYARLIVYVPGGFQYGWLLSLLFSLLFYYYIK